MSVIRSLCSTIIWAAQVLSVRCGFVSLGSFHCAQIYLCMFVFYYIICTFLLYYCNMVRWTW